MSDLNRRPDAEGRWPAARWELHLGAPQPEDHLISTAFCFAFKDGKVAFTRHHRGWDVPGGHREPGETIEEAARRELFEEAGVIAGNYELIGVHDVHWDKPSERDGRPYPFPLSHGLWYVADALEDHPLPPGTESVEMKYFTPDEIRAMDRDFHPAFERALKIHLKRNKDKR